MATGQLDSQHWNTRIGLKVKPLSVLYEDNHLLVVDKPAGIATMGTVSGRPTIARQAANYLKQRYDKPGNVFVGVVSRLDSLVSGVLVLARTSKAASRLSSQIRQHAVGKIYLAMVEGKMQCPGQSGASQELTDYVAKDEAAQRMRVVPESTRGAQLARLRVRVLAFTSTMSLVEIELITGRKHQIRVQLAELGHPVTGDRKYGARRKFSPGIALHCQRLTIAHPTKREPMTFTSPVEEHWPQAPALFLQVLHGQ